MNNQPNKEYASPQPTKESVLKELAEIKHKQEILKSSDGPQISTGYPLVTGDFYVHSSGSVHYVDLNEKEEYVSYLFDGSEIRGHILLIGIVWNVLENILDNPIGIANFILKMRRVRGGREQSKLESSAQTSP